MTTNVYDFLDYREFLKQSIDERKAANKNFSLRFMAQKLEVNSAGLISQIISGKRNLSQDLIPAFCSLFKLNRRQSEYFSHLVSYNQSKKMGDKKNHLEKIISFKESPFQTIDIDKYQLFERWYYIAIREILALFPFRGDFQLLARMTIPPIKSQQAKEAIEVLLRLGFIEKDAKGVYHRKDQVMTTGDKAQDVSIHNFINNSMVLAQDALENQPKQDRSLSTVTLSLSEKEYELINEEIKAFRQKILKIAMNSKDVDRVYQFNFQAFPVSKRRPL